jgi:hypothetical protein
MVHTLLALQTNKEVLTNTMDVFIQEPLLDWEKLARRLATQQTEEGGGASSWFPQNKIDIAKRKLNKLNPAFIMWNELLTSVHQVRGRGGEGRGERGEGERGEGERGGPPYFLCFPYTLAEEAIPQIPPSDSDGRSKTQRESTCERKM